MPQPTPTPSAGQPDGPMHGTEPDNSGDSPPACILTGESGENEADCTTHDHESPVPPGPRCRLTFWAATQYSVDLDLIKVAAKLRAAGYPEAATVAGKITAGEITAGDAAEDAGGQLGYLAHAIRKTDDGTFTSDISAPVDTDDAETYHIYVGEPR